MSASPVLPLDAVLARMQDAPFVRTLGIAFREDDGDDGGVIVDLPFAETWIGNPTVPALHGGVTAAVLQLAAAAELIRRLRLAAAPTPYASTTEFLRSASLEPLHARARLVTRSRRYANLRVEAWQGQRDRPVAAATVQFRLAPPPPDAAASKSGCEP